jgi:hypothetical protein
MSQVIEKQQATPVAKSTPGNVALGYIVLALTPIVAKLLGFTALPWSKVLVTIWGPWVLVMVVSFIGWVWYLIENRRG